MNRGEVEELVQSTVRKMNTGPEACLTNPRVLSFFNIMKDSFHRCLKTLAASSGTPEERTAAYQGIVTWPQERIVEEVELILKRYPSVKDSYTYAAVYIVEQTYKKDGNQMKLKLPSFQSFVHNFYTTMVQSEPVQQGTYDTLQFFEKEMLTCQSFCNALYNSIKTEPIVKPQSVVIEPSAVVANAPTTATASRAGGSRAATPASTTNAALSQVASASRFSVRALSPQDSVSQMRPPTTNTSFRGLLTEEFLNKHRQQIQGGSESKSKPDGESRVSAASQAAASIKKAASKKPSVKVIDIVDHPQRHLASQVDTDSSDSSTEDDTDSFAFQKYSQVDPRVKVVKDNSSYHHSNTRDRDRDRERHEDRRDRDRDRERHEDRSDRDRNRDSDRHERDRDRDFDRREHERSRQNPNRRH